MDNLIEQTIAAQRDIVRHTVRNLVQLQSAGVDTNAILARCARIMDECRKERVVG